MGVAAYQLVVQGVDDIVDCELAALLGNDRMKDDLQKQVAKFLC